MEVLFEDEPTQIDPEETADRERDYYYNLYETNDLSGDIDERSVVAQLQMLPENTTRFQNTLDLLGDYFVLDNDDMVFNALADLITLQSNLHNNQLFNVWDLLREYNQWDGWGVAQNEALHEATQKLNSVAIDLLMMRRMEKTKEELKRHMARQIYFDEALRHFLANRPNTRQDRRRHLARFQDEGVLPLWDRPERQQRRDPDLRDLQKKGKRPRGG